MPASPAPRIPAWPPKSAPRLFVEPELTAGERIELDGNPAHYLARVMRVAAGDTVLLCDDVTGEWAARVVDAGKRSVALEVTERLRTRETVPDLWLCPALMKKDRFDLVLEKATELGAARIRPVITRRCVADKLNGSRARTLTVEAAEQCARTALPRLDPPEKLASVLRDWPDDRELFFADEEGGEPVAEAFARFRDSPRRRGPPADGVQAEGGSRLRGNSQVGKAAILIGPEGGFDNAEREAIRATPQAVPVTLGPRILRAETAAIAALACWMAIAGDWRN